MQVKFIQGYNTATLEKNLNEFLGTLSDNPTIKYDLNELVAIVEYEEARKGAICCECRFWDDSNSQDGLIGMCQRCGGRKRFSDKACGKYEDVRR